MRKKRTFLLFDMLVIADVVFAVAMVAIAPGAVPEFQLRVGYIRPSAYGAAVGVRCLGCGNGGLVGAGSGEGHHLGLFLPGCRLLLAPAQEPGKIHPPVHGYHIQHILAEEQEVVGQGHDGEQVCREGIGKESKKGNCNY